MVRLIVGVLLAAVLAGCVAQTSVPIERRVWRMETRGDGALGTEYARTEVLRDAAGLTLQQGYTHFVIRDAADFPSPKNPINVALFGQFRVMQFGSGIPIPPVAASRAYSEPTVFRAVTVVMYGPRDERPRDAYLALEVLGR